MADLSAITTHVLDTYRGQPASGVPIILEVRSESGDWKEMGKGTTDSDGRAKMLPPNMRVARGVYRLEPDGRLDAAGAPRFSPLG